RGDAVHPQPEAVLAHRSHLCRHPDRCGTPGGHSTGAPGRGGRSRGIAEVRMNKPAFFILLAASHLAGQRSIEPKDLDVFNRTVSALSDGTRKGVRLNEQP